MTFEFRELPKLLSDLYVIVAKLEALAPGRKFTPDGHLVGSIGEAVAAYPPEGPRSCWRHLHQGER